jgi:hypothetical protein
MIEGILASFKDVKERMRIFKCIRFCLDGLFLHLLDL